jgi:disulfide bond formation protein DsbB
VPLVFFLLGAIFLVLAAAAVGPWARIVAGALILVGIAYGAGKVGAQDPLQATEEALRELPAEEILVPAQSDSTLAAETKFGVSVAALTS